MAQVWAINSLGGYLYSDELSDVLRSAVQPRCKFRQFCDAKDATDKGLKKGDKFYWDTFLDVETGGGALLELVAMPEDRFQVEQASLTITEYGNSVPYSGKLDNLSKLPVVDIIHKVMRDDAVKTFDVAAYNQFNLTNLRFTPASGTSTTAIVVYESSAGVSETNNVAFGTGHAKAIVDVMKERNIPAYEGDDYFAVGWPTTFRGFKNSLEAIHQYTESGFTMIRNGEIGRYENTRYIEQTNIKKGGAEDSTTYDPRLTADAWNNALSDWIFFFGEDTVAEGIAIPEELRGKIPSDYGRSRGVAWYYLGGFGIVHGPTGSASQQRIGKWESAA